ncbi:MULTISPECIES: hypothetical protein [Paenibacillus]|uniref:hypothetical protein n=1 Tax=Paenibacillus TaxID=44249 RepID=UPI00046FA296|nr:hypothetical protein [Paenibacillus massiliensis]
MASIILPFYEPTFYTYNIYGSVTSMLSNNDHYLPWLYNNFIQIRYVEDWDSYFFDNHHTLLDNIPWINHHIIPRDILNRKWVSLTDFIIESLHSNYYLYFYVDRSYISVSKQYQQVSHWHEILVYGYDEQKRTFLMADNLADGKYIKTECPIEEIEQGYYSIVSDNEFFKNVHLLSIREERDYSLQIDQIAESIRRYLNSTITVDLSFKEKTLFGMKAVEHSIEKVKDKLHSTSFVQIDRRAFHLFWEHKIIMLQRLRYLMELSILKPDDDVIERYTLIVQQHESLRNLVLKFNFKNDRMLFSRIEQKLHTYLQLESTLLHGVMKELDDYAVSAQQRTY